MYLWFVPFDRKLSTRKGMAEIRTITPAQLKELLENGKDFVLVDVREQNEWDICHIEGALLRPLSQISGWIDALEPDKEYVFHCHHGGRSRQACAMAIAHGVRNVISLEGGIDSWCTAVEPAMKRY